MASDIELMTGVLLSSSFFIDPASLELFPKHQHPPKNNRVALVYGRNGSGKSTIAQGFREYRDSSGISNISLELRNESSTLKIQSSGKKGKIFIFDEEYISSRVKIKDSGLDAIVLFGDQISYDEQIDKIKRMISIQEQIVSANENDLCRYKDVSDVSSPDFWTRKISTKLRETGGWAAVGSAIKQQRQNLSVTDSEIERIGRLAPTRTLDEYKEELDRRLSQFLSVSSSTDPIYSLIPMIKLQIDIIGRTNLLLERNVLRPQLTERESSILQILGVDKVTDSKRLFSNVDFVICDRCFQPINEEYRTRVLSEIDNIMNRDVQDFRIELESLLLAEISISDYQKYIVLPSFPQVRECIEKYNEAVYSHNNFIKVKLDNPFESIEYDQNIGVLERYFEANDKLLLLEAEREDFNRIVSERTTVSMELLILNDYIGHYAIKDMFSSLTTQRNAKESAEVKFHHSKRKFSELNTQLTDLDSKRKNYSVAADEMNASLEYIFFCKNRIYLELGTDNAYHLKVNSKQVMPNKISCGERNALALCYFFTEIAKDMLSSSKYSDELLLVVDDPISSFDIENRIGIMSFLRWKLEEILSSCATSKILIMTHDISVVFDLSKAFQEISKSCQKKSLFAEHCLFHLDGRKLEPFKSMKHNEYTNLMRKVYDYAKAPSIDADSDIYIGNAMRRVLEAFSSFTYKLGIDEVSTEDRVLKLLPDDSTRLYYRNLMYRLVLNNESHFLEKIQSDPEMSFFSHLSSSDKQRTARDILSFIYCLNKEHLMSHLPDSEHDLTLWSKR